MIIDDLFDVFYGTNLELNHLEQTENGINFVSRTAKNNGVSAIVKPLPDIEALEAGLITVAAGGSVMSSFVQNKPFYSGRDIFCLKPKNEKMTLEEKLFYCMCIKSNAYKYSYNRQANRTLKNLELPHKVPSWVIKNKVDDLSKIKESVIRKQNCLIDVKHWKEFTYEQIFEVRKGKRVIVDEILDEKGKHNFVSAIKTDNGIFGKTNLEPNQNANVITVNYDGQGGVAEAFYQDEPFWALDSVNILYPKFKLNPFIAMFLITLIRKERYRFNYGRKWHKERMEKSVILLPVDINNNPDWKFMENYVKSLTYSKALTH